MVKFSAYQPLDGLFDLACRSGVDIRPTLLRVLTDLYIQRPVHSVDEETQYVELVLGLIDAVDAPTRAVVAARLAAYPAAPAVVLQKLSGVASEHVDDMRSRAATSRALAEELVDLFFSAEPEVRCLILINLDIVAESHPRLPAMVSPDAIQRLESAALRRNPEEFTRILAPALGIDRNLAARIVHDNSGEPIVVAAKAMAMPAAELLRILLFINPKIGQSVTRVFDLTRLYDEITLAAAEQMLAIWRQAFGAPRPRHQPLHWNDAPVTARSLLTPTFHHAPRQRDDRASPLKSAER
jgi:hypothetical protein